MNARGATLRLNERTAAQTADLHSVISQAPGGQFLIDHFDDGPFWLTTIRWPDENTHWQAIPVLDYSPHWKMRMLLDMGHVETVQVHALTDIGHQIVCWYTGNEGEVRVDHGLVRGPMAEAPTRSDLARYFAWLIDPDNDTRLRDILDAHAELADTTMPGLLTQLADNTDAADEIAEVLDGILRDHH